MRKLSALLLLLALAVPPAQAVPPPEDPEAERIKAEAFRASMEAKAQVDRETLPGAKVYRERCMACHEGQVAKAPNKTFVSLMATDAIYDALTNGIMQPQSAGLTLEQKQAVAEYLTGEKLDLNRQIPMPPQCTAETSGTGPRLMGWGFGPRNEHYIPADIARLAAADVPRLKLKWALAYPGGTFRARSRPTFDNGVLYVGSQDGTVYALDAKTGCRHWTYRASAEVRTPVLVGTVGPEQHRVAVFGDLNGRVYAYDIEAGKLLWKLKADDHPAATITGAPVLHDGVMYIPVSSLEEASTDPAYECCTFRGSVVAVRAHTGEVLWKSYTILEPARHTGMTRAGVRRFAPSGSPIWNSPTLDLKRGLIYVGTGNAYSAPADRSSDAIVAFDLKTGQRKWIHQVVENDAWNVACMLKNANCPEPEGPDLDIGAGTLLLTAGGKDLVTVGLKDGTVVAIDPDHPEKTLWKRKLGRGSIQGGVQFGMAHDGNRLYVPISDMADSRDGKTYEGEIQPGLNALVPTTGEILWRNIADDACRGRDLCDRGILASIAVIDGVVFGGHMDGRLRGYDAASGKVVWEYDTTDEVTGISGVKGRGGSMGGGGPVVYDGMVYVNSGYGLYFHMPGNLLLAFSVDGK
ncbi:MAG: PQQ-binding-like beta-propeller repeat protein [Gammaproteobacteria bacterium]